MLIFVVWLISRSYKTANSNRARDSNDFYEQVPAYENATRKINVT